METKIKLNGCIFTIKEIENYGEHSGNYGYCDYDNNTILIAIDKPEDRKKLTY